MDANCRCERSGRSFEVNRWTSSDASVSKRSSEMQLHFDRSGSAEGEGGSQRRRRLSISRPERLRLSFAFRSMYSVHSLLLLLCRTVSNCSMYHMTFTHVHLARGKARGASLKSDLDSSTLILSVRCAHRLARPPTIILTVSHLQRGRTQASQRWPFANPKFDLKMRLRVFKFKTCLHPNDISNICVGSTLRAAS